MALRQRSQLLPLTAMLLAGCLLSIAPVAGAPDDREDVAVRVSAVRYSPDGGHLAIGFGERKGAGGLLILDARNYELLSTFPEEAGISSIAYSPNGKWLAYTVFNQGPRLLRTSDYRTQARLPDDRRGPISFSPDSRLLAMARIDDSVAVYDVDAETDVFKLKDTTKRISLALFSNDGRRLLAGGNEGGTLWDVETRQPLHTFKHGRSIVTSGAFSPDDSQFLTSGWDGTMRIWSTADASQICRIEMPIDRVGISHTAKLLAVVSRRPAIELFEFSFGPLSEEQSAQLTEIVADWEKDDYEVRERATRRALELGWPAVPRLQELGASSTSAEIRVRVRHFLEQLPKQAKFNLHGHWDSPVAVAFSPDGSRLASGSQDGTVRIWDTMNGQELKVLRPRELSARQE